MEQPGGRGYPLKSRLREPTNPLSRMPRFHRAVRYCLLRYSAALFAYGAFPPEGADRFTSQRCGTDRVSTAKSGRVLDSKMHLVLWNFSAILRLCVFNKWTESLSLLTKQMCTIGMVLY